MQIVYKPRAPRQSSIVLPRRLGILAEQQFFSVPHAATSASLFSLPVRIRLNRPLKLESHLL